MTKFPQVVFIDRERSGMLHPSTGFLTLSLFARSN